MPGLGSNASDAALGAARCEAWGPTRHPLLQAAHLLLAAAFLVPAVRGAACRLAFRLALAGGFGAAALWAGLRGCAGADAVAWGLVLLVANLAQAARAACVLLPPRIALELQEFYIKVFAPLKVGKDQFHQLIKIAHIEPLDEGENYATEGVTYTDQRLAVLLSGKMKVTCDGTLLHYLQPMEFVDSPEWESCSTHTDKRFQVTLRATEPCQLLCWGRKELLGLLALNPLLSVVVDGLVARDITHKLYALNEQHRRDEATKDRLEAFAPGRRSDRAQSVDMLHEERGGAAAHHKMRSVFWGGRRERHRRGSGAAENNGRGDSRTSNYSDPGPQRGETERKKLQSEDSVYMTPV